MNADGSGQRKLTRAPHPKKVPVWSPDGTKIAFGRFRTPTRKTRGLRFVQTDVYVMNVDAEPASERLARPAWPASWSPDGRKIAFTSGHDGESEIYVMNADGSGQRRLTQQRGNATSAPAWSPDGRKIAFDSGPRGDS